MTSTTTHSSHSSHSSHGSSHHGNHANSISASPTYTYNSHTATIGGVDWSGSVPSSTPLSIYGGSGSLSNLITVINNMRDRYNNSTYNDNPDSYAYKTDSEPPELGSLANPSNLTRLMDRAGAVLKDRYNAITARANVTTNGSHSNTSGTSTQLAAGPRISVHSSTSGKSYHLNTTSKTGYEAPVKSRVLVDPSYSVSSGDKITRSNLTGILSQLENNTLVKWSGPTGDPGTWKLEGSNSYHSSHSNSSSRKVKTGIHPITLSALDLIDKLNLVEFKYTPDVWNTQPDEDITIQHYGFIAEDTPAELSTQYHDRMDYVNCIGILLKAVQELNEEINKLKENKK